MHRTLLMLFTAIAVSGVLGADAVVTYTAPAEALTSTDFTVTANGKSLVVYKNAAGDASLTRHFVNFSMSGTVTMVVKWTLLFTKAIVKPTTEGVPVEVNAKTATFTFTGPRNFSLESNDSVGFVDNRNIPGLYIFANPLEVNVPSATDATVDYFAPGYHNVGAYKMPKTKKVIYLAGGAYLYGKIRVDSLNDVLIMGRGIVYTSYSATRHDDNNASIYINRCNGFRMQGITSCGADTWSMQNIIRYCNQAVIDNHHIIGVGGNDDGLNLVGDYCTFNNVFAATHDDNFSTWSGPTLKLAYTGTHATYLNCVARPGCTRGFQIWDGASFFLYKGCKVIGHYSCNNMPSILIEGAVVNDINNIRYENMSLEADGIWLAAVGKNLYFKNVNVLAPILTTGLCSSGSCSGMPTVFENYVHGGKSILQASDDPSLTSAATFKATDPTAPTVTITSPGRWEDLNTVIGPSTTLTFTITNWTMASGGKGFHYFVNGIDKGVKYSADPIAISDLPTGPNALSIKLVDAAGAYTNVQDAIVVTVTNNPAVVIRTPLPQIQASQRATSTARRLIGIDGRIISAGMHPFTLSALHRGVYVTDVQGTDRRMVAVVR